MGLQSHRILAFSYFTDKVNEAQTDYGVYQLVLEVDNITQECGGKLRFWSLN